MIPLVSHLPPQLPRYGEIPHLASGEWIVVTAAGGHLAHRSRLTIREDGTATYVSELNQKPEKTVRWRLTKLEVRELRALVDGTDFPALHRGPRASYPPSAVDALDRGLAVRQRGTIRGWTNTMWTQPDPPVALFVRLEEFTSRARS